MLYCFCLGAITMKIVLKSTIIVFVTQSFLKIDIIP